MTMPKADRIPAMTERLVEVSREMIANPDDLAVRRRFIERTFNHDWLAAKIVYLANAALPTKDGEAS
jgi:hypothetical protein